MVSSRCWPLGLLAIVACGGGGDGGADCDPIAATLISRIEVTPGTTTLADGSSLQLGATAYSCDGSQITVPAFSWQTSDASTVSVSTTGMAMGVKVGGPVTVTAVAQGKQGAARITVAPQAVASVRVEPATANVAVGRASTLVARAFDAQGQELAGRAATWSGGNDAIATVAPSGAVTGVAVGGPVAITATIEGQSGAAQVTVVQAAVASVAVSPASSTIEAGSTVQLTAVLKDDLGNVLTGRAVLWSTSDAVRASVSNTGLVTGLAPGGPVTILATSEGRSGGAQIGVTTAPAARLGFVVQPSAVVAGAVISPPVQVEIQNTFGARVTTSTASVTIALAANPGSATLVPVTVAAVNGVATFVGLGIDRAASGYSLAASSTGLVGATSRVFDVRAGDPAALAIVVQPSNAVAGSAIAPAIEVEVQDALGNRVPTASLPVTLALGDNPGGDTLSGTRAVNALGGVATFGGVSLSRAGSGYTLTADSPGLAGAASAAFDVTPGAAARLAFAVQPTTIAEGSPFSPEVVVEVQDAFGNRVTSATGSVTVTVRSETGGNPPSQTSLLGGGARPLDQGGATYPGMTVSVSQARTLRLRVASSGLASVLSQSFLVSIF